VGLEIRLTKRAEEDLNEIFSYQYTLYNRFSDRFCGW
jgi:hypothetical protein